MSIHIELPYDDAQVMLKLFRVSTDFSENDYCEFTREDGARITYGPCGAPR